MTKQSTRDKLMDTAEALFAEQGIEAVSVRAINHAAGVSVGGMHYHFRNRDELITAIIRRRMDELQEIRRLRYEALIPLKTVAVADIIKALIEPLAALAMSADPAKRCYVSFIARLYSERSPILEALSQEHFSGNSQRLLMLLKRALPQLPEAIISIRIYHASLLLLSVLAEIGLPGRSWQRFSLHDEQQLQALIDYLVGGFCAPNTVVV